MGQVWEAAQVFLLLHVAGLDVLCVELNFQGYQSVLNTHIWLQYASRVDILQHGIEVCAAKYGKPARLLPPRYVAFSVLYRIGFAIDVEIWSFAMVFDLFVDTYFIADVVRTMSWHSTLTPEPRHMPCVRATCRRVHSN